MENLKYTASSSSSISVPLLLLLQTFVQEQEDEEEEAEATAVTSNLTSAKRKIPAVYLRFHRSASTSFEFSSDSKFETFFSRMRQHKKIILGQNTQQQKKKKDVLYLLQDLK
jgi:hypothetical protein